MKATEEGIKEFQELILKWYKLNGRKFPWREKGLSPYQLIIAEILLQRTKAETVAGFYLRFIGDFPTWQVLIDRTHEVENYLKPIGLYRQRSVRLINLAKEMVARKGVLPKGRKELEAIPFFGQYIINAIELLIFKKNSPLIDVNMARVLERYFGPRTKADIRYDEGLQALALKIVTHKKSKEINWGILDFAALVCKARSPLCETCILNLKCKYFISTQVL